MEADPTEVKKNQLAIIKNRVRDLIGIVKNRFEEAREGKTKNRPPWALNGFWEKLVDYGIWDFLIHGPNLDAVLFRFARLSVFFRWVLDLRVEVTKTSLIHLLGFFRSIAQPVDDLDFSDLDGLVEPEIQEAVGIGVLGSSASDLPFQMIISVKGRNRKRQEGLIRSAYNLYGNCFIVLVIENRVLPLQIREGKAKGVDWTIGPDTPFPEESG